LAEVLLPPWVLPVSPEHIAPQDDQTTNFEASLGRGPGQVQIWADPRWQFKREFKSIRGDERAALRVALNDARGRANIIRATIHEPRRGSFQASELITNGTFSNGIAGWTVDTGWAATVSDRVAQVAVASSARTNSPLFQTITVIANAPHVLRTFTKQGRNTLLLGAFWNVGANISSASAGLQSVAYVPPSGSIQVGILESDIVPSAGRAGDFFLTNFLSVSRCALIDNSPNLLLQSDTLGTTWTTSAASVSSNVATAPDGTSTADQVVDTVANSAHFVQQSVTVSSSSADYTATCYFKSGARVFAFLQMQHATGQVFVGIDLTGGTLGSITTNAGWTNSRASITNEGNGWFRVDLTSNKTSADASVMVLFGPGTSTSVFTYAGTGTSGVNCWRAGFAQSSVPFAAAQTTTSASTGTSQSGSGVNVKGLPASTNGLLSADDFFEINGELKQCTAALNSNAAGLGYMQFRPMLAGSPADGDAIIVNQPMGRFRLMNSYEYDNEFGLYMDATVELTEVYG
jgi:hypothetical protein